MLLLSSLSDCASAIDPSYYSCPDNALTLAGPRRITGEYLMMWHLQRFIEWAGVMLAQDVVLNAVFACLALAAAFDRTQRVCAMLTALVYVILMIS